MLHSMTGYGTATNSTSNYKITIDIKTLNSKSADINLKIPSIYKEKEIELRQILSTQLQRGKIDCNINLEILSNQASSLNINTSLAQSYLEQLQQLASKLQLAPQTNLISTVLNIPDVLTYTTKQLNDTEWQATQQTLEQAINQTNNFRKQEGEALKQQLEQSIQQIAQLSNNITPHQQQQSSNLRAKLEKLLEELNYTNEQTQNRLEQELLFYAEKLDITEEKVRLHNHCQYFITTLNTPLAGKKLNFITQEIGREINTIGSKANDTAIQHLVIKMKEILEQVKEQIMNVL